MRGLLLLALALAACSPIYVYRSAKGHAGLILRRKSIDKALADSKTPAELKGQLALVQEIRAFGVAQMALRPSKDYTTYSPVSGDYLTWLVTGSSKTKLEAYVWRFPLAGSYPYKGHFREKDARADAARLEKKGLDAYVRGVTAYNTPLWISDPLPTTALQGEPGDLADLLLHELAHGTAYFKGQTEFDEGLASFVGERGAAQFLAARFGKGSAEVLESDQALARQRRFDLAMNGLRERLSALYAGAETQARKLELRQIEFGKAREEFAALGFRIETLNNAVVVAHGVYRERSDSFARAFESVGGSWPQFWVLINALDKKHPLEDLETLTKR